MEHEDAVGAVVGDSGARKVEHVVNGTMESTYVDGELVMAIDRDPKYKLDLGEIRPEVAVDNPYVKLFLEEGIRRVDLDDLEPLPSRNAVMPSPTDEQIASPLFQAIWSVLKSWDVNVPEFYDGYCGANGSHVLLIMNSINGVKDDE